MSNEGCNIRQYSSVKYKYPLIIFHDFFGNFIPNLFVKVLTELLIWKGSNNDSSMGEIGLCNHSNWLKNLLVHTIRHSISGERIVGLENKSWLPRLLGDRWLKDVLPKYQQQIDKIKKINLDKLSSRKLVSLLQETTQLEAWMFGESLYVGIICGYTEMKLKLAYKLFVEDKNLANYHELLIGFPDKGMQMDAKLWKVAQIKEKSNQNNELDKWIKRYGYRIQDKELIYPTLGEDKEIINSLIKLYKKLSWPKN